jgi:hypothetical protein
MLIAWNGRGVVLDRGWSMRGGDCPVVPGFINWEICGEQYGVRESSEVVSGKGPCRLPSPRWRGKYEQSDREILGGSDWLPSRGKSKSANEHTRKFRSMDVST